jgi:hypothetical protein
MKKKQLKLFVWEEHGHEPFYWGEMQEYDLTKPVAFAVSGGG